MTELAGQVALVTGGGRGIGAGIAVELARNGAAVAINYHRDQAAAQAVVGQIEALGGRALALPGDVASLEAVEGMVAATVRAFGRLTIGISNAVYSDREPFHSAQMDGFRRTIDVTMWGAFHLLRAATNQMIEAGQGGNIVFVSSPHAYVPVPGAMAYNMAKAAVDQMARTAATELIEHRIRVNVITPGWIDTPGERKFASEEKIAAAGAQLPWGRLGRTDEVGRGVVFLCSPQNDYCTGAKLLIDGGVTLPWWARGGRGVPE